MSKEKRAAKKANKKPANPEITKSVISSVTAVVCAVMIGVTAVSVSNKICEVDIKLSESTASDTQNTQNIESADNGIADVSADVTSDGTEVTDVQTAQDAAADDSNTGISAVTPVLNSGGSAQMGTAASSTQKIGLNSTNKSEVFKFYVAAVKATGNNVTVTRKKTLEKLDGGNGAVGNIISKLESVGKKALADNSGAEKGFRGSPELIKPDDITSAKATVNGNYTNVTMKVKDYTATSSGKANDGSVGRAIGVLDTLDAALDELPVTIDDTSGIKLLYTNAIITAKIDNRTDKVVSAKWSYDVIITVDNTKIKAFGIPITLDGTEVVICFEAAL